MGWSKAKKETRIEVSVRPKWPQKIELNREGVSHESSVILGKSQAPVAVAKSVWHPARRCAILSTDMKGAMSLGLISSVARTLEFMAMVVLF